MRSQRILGFAQQCCSTDEGRVQSLSLNNLNESYLCRWITPDFARIFFLLLLETHLEIFFVVGTYDVIYQSLFCVSRFWVLYKLVLRSFLSIGEAVKNLFHSNFNRTDTADADGYMCEMEKLHVAHMKCDSVLSHISGNTDSCIHVLFFFCLFMYFL